MLVLPCPGRRLAVVLTGVRTVGACSLEYQRKWQVRREVAEPSSTGLRASASLADYYLWLSDISDHIGKDGDRQLLIT